MNEIEVKYSSRYIKRKRENAVGTSLLKTLAEPITNSDDSYRRLHNEFETAGEIYVLVSTKKRQVKIIDHAEGISAEEFKEKFEYYGADKSGASEGEAVRGLFGQGVTDVLFYHKEALIGSIKNDEGTICRFYERNDKQYIKIDNISPKLLGKYRKLWGIPSNGTLVSFVLSEKTRLADYSTLARKLSNFYMLRLINSDPNRKLILKHTNNKGEVRHARMSYSLPAGTLVDTKNLKFEYSGYPIKVEAKLFRAENELTKIGDEKESGLLVYDERNAVYDLSLFGLDNLPGAEKFYGTMQITGLRKLILDKINDREHPEEILLDSRDGFNTTHPLYHELDELVKEWLYPIVSKERSNSNNNLDEKTNESHRKAFDVLNKIHEQLTGESWNGTIKTNKKKPPKNGLEFAREVITITAGKKYGLQLAIDPARVPLGSKILISASTGKVSYLPKELIIDDDSNIITKTITIIGPKANTADTITATFESKATSTVISIVPEQIYIPSESMEFYPNKAQILKDHDSSLWLYVNLEDIKRKEIIEVESSNANVKVLEPYLKIPKNQWSTNGVCRLKILVRGDTLGTVSEVSARYKNLITEAQVEVVERHNLPPKTLAGKFKDWKFDSRLSETQQAVFDPSPNSPTQGYILINPTNAINSRYFGENPTKNDIEKSTTSQLYLAELILTEFLNVTIPEALQSGTLTRRFGDYDVLGYIQQKKHEYGQSIYNCFVVRESSIDSKREKKKEVLEEHNLDNFSRRVSARNLAITKMYLGLENGVPHSLDAVGKKYGITRERVRQIVDKTTSVIERGSKITD